jgi:hypothetical protein
MSTARVQIRCPIYGQCKLCGQGVTGWIVLNSCAQIIDSDGVMVCFDGIACDPCPGGKAERKVLIERLKREQQEIPGNKYLIQDTGDLREHYTRWRTRQYRN